MSHTNFVSRLVECLKPREPQNPSSTIEKGIASIRQATEEGRNDPLWANTSLKELADERAALIPALSRPISAPQVDAEIVMEYWRQAGKVFREGMPSAVLAEPEVSSMVPICPKGKGGTT